MHILEPEELDKAVLKSELLKKMKSQFGYAVSIRRMRSH